MSEYPDLKRVFVKRRYLRGRFSTFESQLDGVRDGDKPIAMFEVSPESVTKSDDPHFEKLKQFAESASLVITQVVAPRGGQVIVFLHRPEHAWRCQALMSVMKIRATAAATQLFDPLEHMESYLLGYSESEIGDWFKQKRQSLVAASGVTLYFLLSEKHVESLRRLGFRALDPGTAASIPIEAVYAPLSMIAAANAEAYLRDRVLARAAVRAIDIQNIFGERLTDVSAITNLGIVTESDTVAINGCLQSRIELLRNSVWS